MKQNFNLFAKKIVVVERLDHLKTFDDILKELKLSDSELIGLEKKELSLKKLELISKALNKSWKPIHMNDQEKFFPVFKDGVFVGSSYSTFYMSDSIPAYFKSKQVSDHVGTYFADVYENLF
jgi:hypothetical protein